jgi:hypothetical protein
MATDRELDRTSRELIEALDDVKVLESEKRHEPRSTERFHDLADRIADRSKDVYELARQEVVSGTDDSPKPAERDEQQPGDWTDRATN